MPAGPRRGSIRDFPRTHDEPSRRDPDSFARGAPAAHSRSAPVTPFAILGLDEDAGLVEIKRAYARLLKATRPDEDPVAFQRLEEAYAHCIAVARGRQQAAVRAALAGAPH